MKKSVLCILLALMMILTAVPMTANAANGHSEVATGSGEGSLKNVRISQDVILSWDPIPGAKS